jgi:hypothetical protein
MALTCMVVVPRLPAGAQTPGDTIVVAVGPQYAAGRLQRLLLGDNWRDLWVQPIRIPVLDVRTFAGGLVPERRGGGNQSITLHMIDASGRGWIFRSIDKFPERGLPPEIRGTPAEFVVTDHISILHPGGHFILPPLHEAVGVLHPQSALYVMPDDEALGEFRADYAGMIGELEEKANQGPGGTPGFAGSRRIRSTSNFLDDLEDSPQHQLNEREFLRARLIDFLTGDPDRGTDQWRWVRFGESGAYTWRPLPVDSDWVMVRGDGLLARLGRSYYGKLARFGPEFSPIETMTFSTHILDRRLLTRLTRQDVAEEAQRVRAALTDEVLARAIAGMPAEYLTVVGDDILAALQARRDGIVEYADRFYAWLATEVDVRGTDEADLAEVERRTDGTVRVRIRPRPAAAEDDEPPVQDSGTQESNTAFFDRVFLPGETREIRVYLHGGDDHARVTGTPDGPIIVRIIGGGGDDLLEDLAGGTRFYDHRGDNTVVRSTGTRFDDRTWSPPAAPEGMRANLEWAPDWGDSRGISPAVHHHERAGVLVGAEANWTRFGFRRLPHHWDAQLRLVYAPATGGMAAGFDLDQRMPNSRRGRLLEASASTLESLRFHGLGNDTPGQDVPIDRVRFRQLRFMPSLTWVIGHRPGRARDERAEERVEGDDTDDEAPDTGIHWEPPARRAEGRALAGLALGWTDARLSGAPPVPPGTGTVSAVAQLGARTSLSWRNADRSAVPRRGFDLRAEASVYPFVAGAGGGFGSAAATGAAYVPLIGEGLHLAVRAGAEHVLGDYPLFEASFLGGRNSIRGIPADRFAGDGSVSGTVELRMPLDTVTILTRTEVGVLLFVDAGRVWYNGASPGGWHTGYGAGAWLGVLGHAVSVAVARGDAIRAYAWLGLPF